MNRSKIKEKLEKIFHEVFDDENLSITEDMTAEDVDEWDSFNHVRLIVTVEEEFGTTFNTSDVADLRNVGELLNLIEKKKAA